MMTKFGRNDPCPCGSGKKYKRCCLSKHEAAAAERATAAAQAAARLPPSEPGGGLWDDDRLDEASNRVVDLVHTGQLDEAEQAVVSLYAFAGLTGLFAKQAIEMLADVFTVIFKKIQAKDALQDKKGQGDAGPASPRRIPGARHRPAHLGRRGA